jgi:enediyne biosynthesis protein E4
VGGGQFIDVARPTGSDCIGDSRGVAFADFDGDGRMDMAINNNNMPPVIYRNTLRRTGNWIELKLAGEQSNNDAVGARVRLTVAGKTMTRQVEAGSGFAAQTMLPLHFGLGQAAQIEALEIVWPSGQSTRFAGAQLDGLINRQLLITEGSTEITRLKPGEQMPHKTLARHNAAQHGAGI